MRIYSHIIRLVVAFTVWFTSVGLSVSTGTPPPDPTPEPNLAQPFSSAAASRVLLPIVKRTVVSNIDLVIGAIEPTQTIQTPTNTVGMVANRPTIVRIYTQTDNGSTVGNVRVSLTATRNGAPLSGSPLIVGPGSVPPAWARGDINTSFNARLPQAWLSGLVTIQVRLDSSNAVAEKNEANNATTFTLNFGVTPNLDVKVVPITYNDPGGLSYPPADTAFLRPSLLKLYPVAQATVSSRAGITVSCDLDTDDCWDNLLTTITTLKKTDNAPLTQFYYGMIPIKDASNRTWFYGGTAGLGWVGSSSSTQANARASIGLADWIERGIDGGLIAAHEMGHNLGRYHAPCGVSGDTRYPYVNGMLGSFGLDIDLMSVKDPGVYSDVMGYCDQQWISDYTYNALTAALQTNVGAGPYPPGLTSASGMLIRARLDEAGAAELEPAYALDGYIDAPAIGSEYAVEFLDEAGQVVQSYPVAVLSASEPGIEVRRINALAPLPAKPFAAYRLTRGGEALAERSLAAQKAVAASADAAPRVSVSAETLLISWGSPQSPALVRYTLDGGLTWTTLALDWLGGEFSLPVDSLPGGKVQFQILTADTNGQTYTFDWEK